MGWGGEDSFGMTNKILKSSLDGSTLLTTGFCSTFCQEKVEIADLKTRWRHFSNDNRTKILFPKKRKSP
ncbi:MAG: hypothetical protein ACJATA_001583 [Sphingobacteriales bacterium]